MLSQDQLGQLFFEIMKIDKTILTTIISLSMILVSCGGSGSDNSGSEGNNSDSSGTTTKEYYRNPVIANNCPDPTVLDDRARTGYFYAYSTQNGTSGNSDCKYLPIYRSKNLVTWEYVADGFGVDRPQWVNNSRVWAPDINYVNGEYVLYYALGLWDDSSKSSSGVAVSDSPTGPFVDKGMVVSFENTGVSNSIDPMLFIDDDGKKYLFWGSYGNASGIWGVELSDDCFSVKEGATPVKLGYENMEGTYVIKRNGYYYMFNSKGSCCSGESSTYHIVVSRSTSPLGPYEGADGVSLLDANFANTILSSRNDKVFVGPGHDAQIITDDSGQDWMAYHAYWSGNSYNGRCMLIDKIVWQEDGWPKFQYSVPTVTNEPPVWNQ